MASRTVILVTGANSGIGYETVKALLQSPKSHRILMGSRFESKGKSAVEALQHEFPESKSSVEPLQIDLTSDESIENAFEKLKTDPGHIDVLVNNAGKHGRQVTQIASPTMQYSTTASKFALE